MQLASWYSSFGRWLLGALLIGPTIGVGPAAGQTRPGRHPQTAAAPVPGYRLRTLYHADRPDEQPRDTGFVGLHEYYRLTNVRLTGLRRGGYAGVLFSHFRRLLLARWIHDSLNLQTSFTGPLPFRGNLLEAPLLGSGSGERMLAQRSIVRAVQLLVTPRHDSLLLVRVERYLELQRGEAEAERYWFRLRGGRVLLLGPTWYDTVSYQRPTPLARVLQVHGRWAQAQARQQVKKPYRPADMVLESVDFGVSGLRMTYRLCRPTPDDLNEAFSCDASVFVTLPYRRLDPALFAAP